MRHVISRSAGVLVVVVLFVGGLAMAPQAVSADQEIEEEA